MNFSTFLDTIDMCNSFDELHEVLRDIWDYNDSSKIQNLWNLDKKNLS